MTDLHNARLLIPAIQAEPLSITKIAPSPCTTACPAGINVKAYVSLIAEGKYVEALETIRERCPLPAICGRVCHHPCESACRRGEYDEAVSIRALKRFVADLARDAADPIAPPLLEGKRVAIIGSGPAGLAAAFDLRMAGIASTIFEAEDEAGGMLRYGIADYRLPPDILDAEIDVLVRTGVEIRTRVRIGQDVTLNELRAMGYDATLIAVGAQNGRRLGVPGDDTVPEVEDALSFLRRVKLGDRLPPDERIVVIGGGSTAIEAARTAIRFHATSVEILYRRYREELLADEEEIDAAESEGARFRFLVAPRRIVTEDGAFAGLECVQVGLGEPDASGRRKPIEIPGSEFLVRANRVLVAVGQEADFSFIPDALRPRLTNRGKVFVDRATSMTEASGIFAAGDAVSGPATVIEAIADGHRAAEAIVSYLGIEIESDRAAPPAVQEYELPDPEPLPAARMRPPLAPPHAREPFAEVERVLTESEAVAEARRCLRCGPCGECHTCATSCSRRHVTLVADREVVLRTPASIARGLRADAPTPALLLNSAHQQLSGGRSVEVFPLRTHVHLERCRGCGRCVDVCPFHAVALSADAVSLDASLCRGCGLCTSVCPTSAIEVAGKPTAHARVIACENARVHEPGVVRVRCIGQLDAGTLLELVRHGPILLKGCDDGTCRFADGIRLADQQVAKARRILASLGFDESRIGGH